MKKFSRKLKTSIIKLKKVISSEELLALKKWLISLCNININIIRTNEKMRKEKLLLGVSNIRDLEREIAKRGEVFFVDFGYGIGSEYRYNHYCVILKIVGKMAIVVPLTSQNSSHNQNTELVINLGKIAKMPGPKKDSYALFNQIRSISRARLKRPSDKSGKKFYPKLNKEQLNKIDSTLDLLKK